MKYRHHVVHFILAFVIGFLLTGCGPSEQEIKIKKLEEEVTALRTTLIKVATSCPQTTSPVINGTVAPQTAVQPTQTVPANVTQPAPVVVQQDSHVDALAAGALGYALGGGFSSNNNTRTEVIREVVREPVRQTQVVNQPNPVATKPVNIIPPPVATGIKPATIGTVTPTTPTVAAKPAPVQNPINIAKQTTAIQATPVNKPMVVSQPVKTAVVPSTKTYSSPPVSISASKSSWSSSSSKPTKK